MNKSSTKNDVLEISKSQRKREAHELLELAKKLISMPEAILNSLPMDQDLRDAVDFARSIRAHGARKRQLMTVGKMLRKRDSGPLTDAVNNIDQKNRQENVRFHQLEAWRDRLIEDSDQALSELLKHSPDINVQILRQLIRNAQKEIKLGKPPTAARKLFKLLRDTDAKSPLPPLSQN
jgi:ribosome-associated protein